MKYVAIIPNVGSLYKNQIKYCVDNNIYKLLKNIFKKNNIINFK